MRFHGFTARTGLPDVDDGWPSFYAAVHALSDSLARFDSTTEIESAFDEVAELALPLFRREEETLLRIHDRHRHVHAAGHRRFLEALRSFRHDYRQRGVDWDLVHGVRESLRNGLREHHVVMDGLLGRSVERYVRDQRALDVRRAEVRAGS